MAKLFYGLFHKDELVAAASFAPLRTGAMASSGSVCTWEVIRYASIGRVRGGFSKILKKFVEEVCPEEIISYCDLRFGDGSLYKACGFTLDRVTEPDYWWVPEGKVERVPRYRTQKHKLKAHPVLKKYYRDELSEKEICQAAGWYRIYGVGHQRWVWTP